jgi:hypothetical protein
MGTYIATRTRRKQHSLVAYVVRKETFQTTKLLNILYCLLSIRAVWMLRKAALLVNCLLSLILALIFGKLALRSIPNYFTLWYGRWHSALYLIITIFSLQPGVQTWGAASCLSCRPGWWGRWPCALHLIITLYSLLVTYC